VSVERLETDVAIVGGGVIGLAIAEKLAPRFTVILAEAYSKFGQETSSRNSEVIHSGIYYPLRSNKTEWCIRGRELLYDFCARFDVPYKKTGKLVVATLPEERAYLEKLARHCSELKVPFERWTADKIHAHENYIKVVEAVYLPETGIVDSHAFMARLERLATEAGAICAYRHKVKTIERDGTGWRVAAESPDGEIELSAQFVINAAGLGAAEISNACLGVKKYQHKFCRGRYFGLSGKFQNKFSRLIYPVPPKDGLGIHITVDLSGAARLGPDVEWSKVEHYNETNLLYDCDWEGLVNDFAVAARRYCPSIEVGDLSPGLVGIRPKLFIDGTATPDFIVENFDGFVHCLGIESPGLTSSLAISDEVLRLLSSDI
jgi:2-hydroxyglutarate dehydrogenase